MGATIDDARHRLLREFSAVIKADIVTAVTLDGQPATVERLRAICAESVRTLMPEHGFDVVFDDATETVKIMWHE